MRILAAAKGDHLNAVTMAEARGASDRAKHILKAAVGGLGSAGLPELVAAGVSFATYASTLAASGAFFAAYDAGLFTRVPFERRVNFDSGLALGAVVGKPHLPHPSSRPYFLG